MIWQAVHAGFGYFQREAGYTRTGSHNTRVHGRETGQWHEADLAVAHWLQHTSRDGDMQLHVHSQIAHVARTATDGKWRAPDSLGYNEHVGAVAAIVSQHLEEALTAPVRPGVDRPRRRPRLRDQGHLRGDDARVLLAPRVDHRRPARPRRAVRAALRPRAVPARARAARAGVELRDAQRQGRRAGCRAAARGLGGQARAHPRRARWRRSRRRCGTTAAGRAAAQPRGADGPVLTELELARAAQKAVALAQQEKSTWTRADVIKYLGRVLPRTGRDPAAAAALLEDLADRALRSEFEPVALPGGARAGRGSAQLAARRRAQRLPAARRHPVRHARAAGHGRAHARAGPRGRRAAPDPRAGRARARRGPRRGSSDALAGRAHDAHARSARGPGCARTRPPRRCRC